MSCYHVQQLLLLAWYSLTLDWTIFHPEPALLLIVLTTQRRPSPKSMYMYPKESEVPNCKGVVSKLITNNDQIPANYSDVFDGIGCFLGPQYHIQVDPSVTPKHIPCQAIQVHLKESFKKEIYKMLQQEFWSLWTPGNSLDQQICSCRGKKISLEISNWESVLTQSIWIKSYCMNHITSRPQKI